MGEGGGGVFFEKENILKPADVGLFWPIGATSEGR